MNLDIKLDFNEIFDKAFAALAKAMNIAEEQLLPIMAEQMFYEGLFGLITFGAFLLLIFFMYFVGAFLHWRSHKEYSSISEFSVVLYIGASIMFFIWFMVAFTEGDLKDDFTQVMNPEYAVIEKVVDMASDLLGGKK